MKRLAILALLLCVGCANHSVRHAATVSVVSAHAALKMIQQTADDVTCSASVPAPCLSVADRKEKVAPLLSKAFAYDEQAALLIRQLPEGAPQPGEVGQYLGQIGGIIDQVLALIPNSQPKAALVKSLGGK